MSIEGFIKKTAGAIGHRVMIAPNIMQNKLEICIDNICQNTLPEYVLIFADATLTGKGTIGFAFTGTTLYYANDKGNKQYVLFEDIYKAEYIPKKENRNDNVYKLGDKIVILTSRGETLYLENCLIGFDCQALVDIINSISLKIKNGEIAKNTIQNKHISEMEEEVKILYVKLLCNYAYINDNVINSEEYSTIQNIIVRIELNSLGRTEIRNYMSDIMNKEKSGDLLYKIKSKLEYGEYDILKYSLLQDVLYIKKVSDSETCWYEDGFIGSLLKVLDISIDQIELMDQMVDINISMVEKDINLYSLQSKLKTLVKEAIYLNIPIVSLYCSGSTYNLDTYNKIFGGKDRAQLSIDKQREFMLQAVIRNNQKTLNNLVEEMNNISEQLIEEIGKGLQANEKINKLSALLGRLSAGAKKTVQKSDNTERNRLYAILPSVLEISKFENIDYLEKNHVDYKYILEAYPIKEESKRYIRNDLDINSLNRLKRLLDIFNYSIESENSNE